jgi:putative aldouronate transport system substrate-binding protein
MKRTICLLLAICLLLGLAACQSGSTTVGPTTNAGSAATGTGTTAAKSNAPAYLNLDSILPICKEPVAMKLVYKENSYGAKVSEPDNLWFFQWAKKAMGIDIQALRIDTSSLKEQLTLWFASDQLPDVMLDCNLSTSDIVKYGSVDQQLLKFDSLINQYCPNIQKLFAEEPATKGYSTCPDGHIYSLPGFMKYERTQNFSTMRIFLDESWLTKLNMRKPNTLDDLYKTLIAVRDTDLNNNGKKDEIPFCGTADQLGRLVWNSYGLLTYDGGGISALSPTINVNKNNHVSLAAANKDMYLDYLSRMSQYFHEKLLDNDAFTINSTQISAKCSEKRVFMYGHTVPMLAIPNDFQSHGAIEPITSSYNTQRIWPQSKSIFPGKMLANAKTKIPEVIARFADWFFTDQAALYAFDGPEAGSKDLMGKNEGWTLNGDQGPNFKYTTEAPNLGDYRCSIVGMGDAGHVGLCSACITIEKVTGVRPSYPSGGGTHWRQAMDTANVPYYKSGFPIVYFNATDNQKIIELTTPLSDYIKQMEAKFITGTEPLANFDNYMAELEKLGLSKLQKYYVDAYATYLANLK